MENQAHNTMGASPCEAELQELMEQIDIMVSNKKLDWERKMRALETQLDLRDQELANAQTCLDQKGQEVGLLRQKLDSLEKCNLEMTQNYEGQLQTLKDQFSQLTNSFEKLRLHQMKQNKIHQKELSHKEEIPFELSNLNQKLEAMEAGLLEVKNELQSRDDLLRIIEMERLQLHRELLKIGEFQNSQENKKRLESSYSPSIEETERKKKELFSVVPDQPNQEKQLNKIRNQLYQEEEYHNSEQERMRNEISNLTEELHQKEITIATVMKKAALLERQLKIELERKEKILAKQQFSDMQYKAVRMENTHLKGMMGDLDPGWYMSMDFTNKAHSRHTSISKLEYENKKLQSDLAKLHVNGKSAWPYQNTYEETGSYTYQSQIKMEKNEDRLGQDSDANRSATPPLPSLTFQTKEITSPFISDDEVFPLPPPDISFPASFTAQHFLLEEEKRTKELEQLLNTHIDELQRHTEFTLNKYTKLKPNKRI
ncbi:deuterosome assembly protein 1 isoform X8 [Heterocephalus glaber]|uniref:Deuterosome assembly protein 1 n=1 Tax=Heterocephalus glaber TaxID=10181 RepID=A0AAX6SFP9_HETGA|nr:deuterosome assembly protein 1 isoform X8 [Heterocephalus glaber]